MIPAMSKRHSRIERARLQELLRRIRVDAGMRQGDLAQKLGQPQSFVSKYETGERRLDILELSEVCEAVGITLEEFVKRLEAKVGRALLPAKRGPKPGKKRRADAPPKKR